MRASIDVQLDCRDHPIAQGDPQLFDGETEFGTLKFPGDVRSGGWQGSHASYTRSMLTDEVCTHMQRLHFYSFLL